ncbi:MAG TPA: hypothetical protein VGF97_11300 [Rhizomicrobium sp.]|jgi:hypothetical protein
MSLSHHLASVRRRAERKPPLSMLVGFAPFVVFALLSNLSPDLALWAAFATAFAIGIRDFAHEKLLRLLDVGSATLFGLLALYAGFIQPGMTIEMVRLVVDGGLFAISLLSILLRNPLTLQYAREQVPSEFWTSRRFIASNYGLTSLWMVAFAAMASIDALSNIDKRLPLSFDAALVLLVLLLAIAFTARYPAWLRAKVMRADLRRHAPAEKGLPGMQASG